MRRGKSCIHTSHTRNTARHSKTGCPLFPQSKMPTNLRRNPADPSFGAPLCSIAQVRYHKGSWSIASTTAGVVFADFYRGYVLADVLAGSTGLKRPHEVMMNMFVIQKRVLLPVCTLLSPAAAQQQSCLQPGPNVELLQNSEPYRS